MNKLGTLLYGALSISFTEWIGTLDWHLIIQTSCQVAVAVATVYSLLYKKRK
jgi:hypothetical protein